MATTLKRCHSAKADEATKSGIKLKFSEFDHDYSIRIVNEINEITKCNYTADDGVCAGLCFAYLAHRALKDRFPSSDGDQEQFTKKYEEMFLTYVKDAELRNKIIPPKKSRPSFKRVMSEKVGKDASMQAHIGVQIYMKEQDESVDRVVEALGKDADLYDDLQKERKGLPSGGPRALEIDRKIAKLDRVFDYLSVFARGGLYRGMGQYFLPGLRLADDAITNNTSQWEKHPRLTGESHQKAYHVMSFGGHMNALATSHVKKSYKFFEPNEGIMSAGSYELLMSIVKPYIESEYPAFWIYTFA